MSDKISAVTNTATLANGDLFALAKDTGGGYASRNVSMATLIEQLVSSETFIDALTVNQDFIDQLVQNSDFITALVSNSNYINNQKTVLRTTVEEVTDNTYTLVLADADHKWKRFVDTSPFTVTVPADADVDWPDNAYIELEMGSSGAVTVVGDTGVTVNYNENLTNVLNGDYSVAGLKKTGADEWTLFGNLVPA
jgi:hypothetical protein